MLLAAFCVIETRVAAPMFRLGLFRIRAFAAGNLAALLTAIARGGLQFMMIIWLQGIWLPLHGYSYEDTPLWAGIYMLPLTAGFLVAGPTSGYLSDRYGARRFATGGLVIVALSFIGLLALPVVFDYRLFALLLLLSGIGQGMFSAPNTSAIMSSVPPGERGVASGMRSTFQNSGTALSIGIFFSLMIAGLAAAAARDPHCGADRPGRPREHRGARRVAATGEHAVRRVPRRTTRSATCSAADLDQLPAHNVAVLTGHQFFPQLVAGPFHHGLVIVFTAAAAHGPDRCRRLVPAGAASGGHRHTDRRAPRAHRRDSTADDPAGTARDGRPGRHRRQVLRGRRRLPPAAPDRDRPCPRGRRAGDLRRHRLPRRPPGGQPGATRPSPRSPPGRRFTAADPDAAIHPEVAPTDGDIVVTKKRVSAFAGSDLETVLRGRGIDHLVLTGIATSGVVLSTLRQAADLDYGLTVLADGCLDADPEVHRVLTEKVFPRQAEVGTVAGWVGQQTA